MNNWFLKENNEIKIFNNINDFGKDVYGFIYIITHIPTKKKYLGKKSLFHNIKKKLTKEEMLAQTGPGRKPTTKIVKKESDWLTYYSSSDYIKLLVKEGKKDEFTREILQLVYSKKLLTYYECKYLFTLGSIEPGDDWLNNNVLGKFYTKDFE